jgi:hypothetical protein
VRRTVQAANGGLLSFSAIDDSGAKGEKKKVEQSREKKMVLALRAEGARGGEGAKTEDGDSVT